MSWPTIPEGVAVLLLLVAILLVMFAVIWVAVRVAAWAIDRKTTDEYDRWSGE